MSSFVWRCEHYDRQPSIQRGIDREQKSELPLIVLHIHAFHTFRNYDKLLKAALWEFWLEIENWFLLWVWKWIFLGLFLKVTKKWFGLILLKIKSKVPKNIVNLTLFISIILIYLINKSQTRCEFLNFHQDHKKAFIIIINHKF